MDERSQSEGSVTPSVDDVIITEELPRRPARPPDFEAESRALSALAEGLMSDPHRVMRRVPELILRLCHADSAGISVLEEEGGEELFRWRVIAGELAHNLGGTMPRSASPCGTAVARNRVLLFNEAERVFPALRSVEPRIYENLLAPWEVSGRVAGTVWAVKHTPEGRFDAEDARLLASLARFAGAAYSSIERARHASDERIAALNLMEDAIAARRETEQAYVALRESEEKYRALFDSIDEGFCIIEMICDGEGRPVDFRYVEANEGFARQTGRRPAPGQTMRGLFPEAEDMWLDKYAEVVRTGRPQRFVDYNEGLDRWYDVYVFPTTAPKERMQLAALFSDVTDKRRAEQALRASEARLQKALSVETVGVLFFNEEGRFTGANEAFSRMSGYTREEMSSGGLGWEDLTPPEWMAPSREAIAELKATGRISPYEKEYFRRDGSRFWGLFAGSKVSEQETVEYVLDVSDRKRAEERLRGSEERLRQLNEQLEERVRERTLELAEANVSLRQEVRERRAAEEHVKNLLRQLVTVQEEERRRIARELHDTLGQQLAALHLSIEMIRAESEGRARLREHIGRTRAIFDRLNSDVDFLAWELRPAALDHLGLDAALQTFVREWSQQFGVQAHYQGLGMDGARLPAEVETNLYRILQEALQNVHKHAEARRVSVILEQRDGRAVLIVEDDGRGYDADAEEAAAGTNKGMGVTNMRERAALVGGTFEIESGPGAGTTVFVRVPVGDPGGGRERE